MCQLPMELMMVDVREGWEEWDEGGARMRTGGHGRPTQTQSNAKEGGEGVHTHLQYRGDPTT